MPGTLVGIAQDYQCLSAIAWNPKIRPGNPSIVGGGSPGFATLKIDDQIGFEL